MKKTAVLLLISFFFTFSAKAGEFEISLENFRLVKVVGKFKVNLVQSTEDKIKITNHSDLSDNRIITEINGNELLVKIKRDVYKGRNIEVTIFYKHIIGVTASKGAIIESSDTLGGDFVRLDAEFGGKIKIPIACETLDATITTGGSIHISGKCDLALYEVSAGGTIGAISVEATKVEAKIRAGGEIICKVIDELKIKIVSGGTVSYMGDPKGLEQDVTLGGNIAKLKSE